MSAARACDACLRRSWLIARLSGRIEIARHQGRRLREVLALPADTLVEALAGSDGSAVARAHADRDLPHRVRAAAAAASQIVVCRHDGAYPARLRDLADAPAALYVVAPPPAAGAVADQPPAGPTVPAAPHGPTCAAEGAAGAEGVLARLHALCGGVVEEDARAVAVVGSRRPSADGMEVARGLGRGLSAAGVAVVSGMALGIDAAAHTGALEGGGRTVAVLGCGADLAYPRRKAALREAIARVGVVLSELPPGSPPRRWTFPARNRTIAALAQMTVVVEAAARSGSLITAECAADLGREVAALPGSVLSWRSDGTNALLRDGATLVRHAADVLDAVVGLDRPAPPADVLAPRLRSVLAEVSGGRDSVAALAGTPDRAQRALRDLTELELLGLVRRTPGGRYVPVPR